MVTVRLLPAGSVRCGAQAWTTRGRWFVTAVAKAAFAIGEDGVATPIDDCDEIRARDEHHEKNPTRSLRDCSDLAPYLARAEVLYDGSAVVPAGQRSEVRLAVGRPGQPPAIDKRVLVVAPAGTGLVRVPLRYEAAVGGPGRPENPVGSDEPRLLNATDPALPASLGPVARGWKARASLLRPEDKRAVTQKVPAIGDGFAWEYFHAAPADQRMPELFTGDELVSLEGLTPSGKRVAVRFPAMRAAARRLDVDPPQTFALSPDLLRIDGERMRLTVTSRAYVEVADAEARVVLAVGVALPTRPIAWPETIPDDDAAAPGRSERRGHGPATGMVEIGMLAAPTLPFDAGASEPAERRAAPSGASGAPWDPLAATPVPRPSPFQATTLSTSGDAPRAGEMAAPATPAPKRFSDLHTRAADPRAAARPATPFAGGARPASAPRAPGASTPALPWEHPQPPLAAPVVVGPTAVPPPAVPRVMPAAPRPAPTPAAASSPPAPPEAVAAPPAPAASGEPLVLPATLGSELLMVVAAKLGVSSRP